MKKISGVKHSFNMDTEHLSFYVQNIKNFCSTFKNFVWGGGRSGLLDSLSPALPVTALVSVVDARRYLPIAIARDTNNNILNYDVIHDNLWVKLGAYI